MGSGPGKLGSLCMSSTFMLVKASVYACQGRISFIKGPDCK